HVGKNLHSVESLGTGRATAEKTRRPAGARTNRLARLFLAQVARLPDGPDGRPSLHRPSARGRLCEILRARVRTAGEMAHPQHSGARLLGDCAVGAMARAAFE